MTKDIFSMMTDAAAKDALRNEAEAEPEGKLPASGNPPEGYIDSTRSQMATSILIGNVRAAIGEVGKDLLHVVTPDEIAAAREEIELQKRQFQLDVGATKKLDEALKDLAEIASREPLENSKDATESLTDVAPDQFQQPPTPGDANVSAVKTHMPRHDSPEDMLNRAPEQALGAAGSVVGGVMGGLTDAVKGTVNLATKGALAATRGLSSVVKAPAKLSENIIQQHHDKKIDGVRNRIESLFGLQKQMKLVPSWATVVDDVEKLAKQANISKAEAMRKYESEPLGKANIEKALNDEKFKALRAQFDDGADLLEKDMAAAVDAAKKSGKNPEDISSFVEEQLEKLGEHLPGAMQKRLQEMAERIKEMVQRLLEFLHISKPSAGPALKPG